MSQNVKLLFSYSTCVPYERTLHVPDVGVHGGVDEGVEAGVHVPCTHVQYLFE